jgi:hypothetical protein
MNWRGPVFDRRYGMTVVTDEDAAGALIDGTPLVGHWYNRTLEFAAHLHGEDIGPLRYATVGTVLGVQAILSRDPQHRPASLTSAAGPRRHKAARKAFYEIYAAFVAAFWEASDRRPTVPTLSLYRRTVSSDGRGHSMERLSGVNRAGHGLC